MIQTEIERMISELREAADSISSQSLFDIQAKIRKAADLIEQLKNKTYVQPVDEYNYFDLRNIVDADYLYRFEN